jgi:hypothetical protein
LTASYQQQERWKIENEKLQHPSNTNFGDDNEHLSRRLVIFNLALNQAPIERQEYLKD